MSKEKQIEEMAKEIQYARESVENWHCRDTNCLKCEYKRCKSSYVAERLYSEGYRKQIEGEWLSAYDFAVKIGATDEEMLSTAKGDKWWKFCSRCSQQVKGYHNYCPNCGSKMKGGGAE